MSILSKVMTTVAKAKRDRAPDELREAHEHIGRAYDRLDGRQKVTGTATFSAEYALDGLVHGALVHATIAKGHIVSIDATEALAAPGVLAVITHENAPKMKPPPPFDPTSGTTNASGSTAPVLSTNEIFWNGQPVAVVVADTVTRAEHATSLVKVVYREDKAALSFEDAKKTAKKPKNILGEPTEIEKGKPEAALEKAHCRVDQRYCTPFYNHNAIEPHATTAAWEGDKVTIYDATQNIAGVAGTIAKIFGLGKDAVRVLSPFVGGGFGGKGMVWPHVQLCVAAAKVVGRPVRLAITREAVFRSVGGRTRSEQRVAIGAREDGTFESLIHTGVVPNSTTNEWPEQFTFPARHLYASDNIHVCQSIAKLNMTANTAMRAPGESIGTFALESAVDELAHALHLDPIELRRKNEPERDPLKDTPFSSRHVVEAFRVGAEKFGWDARPMAPCSQRDGEWQIGQGVATAFYPVYRMPAAARVRIHRDGSALVQTSAQEMGMGTATAQTQHAAERFGLPMDKVHFEYGDSSLPAANQAGGSSQTVSIALAVQLAFEKIEQELLSLAKKSDDSPLRKADLEGVIPVDGGLYLREDRTKGEKYAELVARSGKDFVEAEVQAPLPLEMMKYSMHSFGAQFCEVRVSAVTGEIRVSRWLGCFDVGRIVNPKLARSQLRGGIIMGIGMALTEEAFFDERSGRIVNATLAEYHVPVHADIPEIEVHFLDIPDPHTPMGAHGVGEIGITGSAAAIANAIFHATGKRIRQLPITLDKVTDAPSVM